MRRAGLLLIAVLLLSTLISNPATPREARRPYLVRVQLTKEVSPPVLLTMGFDILSIRPDGSADIAVTEEQLAWLSQSGALVSILERADLVAPMDLDENLGLYTTYAELFDTLFQLNSLYPSITLLDTLGTSIEGRYIVAIKISDNVGIDEDEPEVCLMGCHHARELMSVEVPLYFAAYLLEHYGTDPEVTDLVDNRELWVIPMVNPDGHVYVQNNHTDPWWDWWRKNRRDNGDGSFGVDLNRNYGYMWGYDDIGSSPDPSNILYRGTGPFSEPETQTIRDFFAGREIIMAISYHSYGELILYPWGYISDPAEDHDLLAAVADSMNSGLGYSPSSGFELYPTNGDTDDWVYGDTVLKPRGFSFCVELNSYEEGGFGPPDHLIAPTCAELLDLNLAFMHIAGDPVRVMGPESPVMHDVAQLAVPSYMLSWSGGIEGDPNEAQSWDLLEFKNISSLTDSCLYGDSLWTLSGFTISGDRAVVGSESYYSGMGNHMSNTMETVCLYPSDLGATFSCYLWYDIEDKWDYAYLEASFDQGYSWITVPGNRTTNSDPNGNNRGNGITGVSGGWVSADFFLNQAGLGSGDIVLLRFHYVTDASIYGEGLYADLIDPTPFSEQQLLIAEAYPDTFLAVTPTDIGTYYYLARGEDSDGQKSGWSNVVEWTVTDLTDADTPAHVTTLAQNYPNPFNPTTTIRFTVGEGEANGSGQAYVSIALYDVLGRRVAQLKDEVLPLGDYSVVWDGTDGRGASLASGIYFVRLDVGEATFTRKMVLLR
jgi:hypothetical protein